MESMKDYEKELEESYKLLDENYIENHETEDNTAWLSANELFESGETFSVKIKEAVRGGVVAYVDELRAFIPASQLSDTYVENLEDWVGKHITVRITEVDQENEKIILSAKEVLREKQAAEKKKALSEISVGNIYDGTVESLQPYGAFVMLENGISGLLHVSQISESPRAVLKEGQKVRVKIIKIDDQKLSLSMRDIDESDWDSTSDGAGAYTHSESVTTNLGSLFANISL